MTAHAETAAAAALSAGDRGDLARLETIIDRGRETFRAVALALLEIQDRRLYRATHPTFQAYCRERWGFHAQNGYRLIQAAKLIRERERAGLPPPTSAREAQRMRTAARAPAICPAPPAAGIDAGAELPRAPANDRRALEEGISATRPGLAKTAAIEKHLAALGELHAAHPWRTRADELLTLYRETVLPWPAGAEVEMPPEGITLAVGHAVP